MIKSWFVSQGKNYDTERSGDYIMAPRCRADGAERSFWTNITRVNPGDLIIHYSGAIKSISQAKETAQEITIDEELAQQNNWDRNGWQLKCDYFDLKSMISVSKFKEDILKYGREDLSAFNVNANVKQGYLFELNPVLCSIFLDKAIEQNPKLADMPVVDGFLKQEFDPDSEFSTERISKNKKDSKDKETNVGNAKMTNQMLSNLERLIALHESTHLVKPASYKENLPERYKKNIVVDTTVIPKESVAELANTTLRKYLEDGVVTEDEIYDMRFIDYSEKTFGIAYPLLLRVKAKTFEDSPKYFDKPVMIGKDQFYICSSWTEDQRDKLESWINKMKAKAEALPEYKGIGIRELVKTVLRDLLMDGKANDEELAKMLTLEYSSETFGINYPLLVTERNQSNVANYFKLKVPIRGVTYYLCSQWFEQPKNNDRPQLEKWIKEHRD